MPKFDAKDYLSVTKYRDVLETFHAAALMLLFEFAQGKKETRDIIIRNFIARTDMTAKSVFHLWDPWDYQGCWVLHRSLLDRLFHLWHLQQYNEFEVFEEWSFLEKYNAINRVRSDTEFSGARESKLFNLTSDQKERAKALIKKRLTWLRPRAEDVAKGMDMHFLYRFDYDFCSTHVHPMADDGDQDFYRITGLKPIPTFPDYRSVLSNTLLIAIMLVQQGLNASIFSWHASVYDLLDDLKLALDTGADNYKISFIKISAMFEEGKRLFRAVAK